MSRSWLWRCDTCGFNFNEGEWAKAPHPFRKEEEIYGCPACGEVEEFVNVCDQAACQQEATCGFPSPGGYRRTCGKHMRMNDV